MIIGAPRQYGTPQASPSPVALGPVTRSDFFEKARNSVISLIGIIAVVPSRSPKTACTVTILLICAVATSCCSIYT